MKVKIKPWLKENGERKSNKEIQKSCYEWSATIWEGYLQSCEVNQKEMLLEEGRDIENFSEDAHKNFYDKFSSVKEYPELKGYFNSIIKELPDKQQRIVHLVYWENMTLTKAAETMSIQKSSASELRKRALVRIGKSFIQNCTRASSPKELKEENLCHF